MKMKALFKEIGCTNKADDIFDKCVIDKNNGKCEPKYIIQLADLLMS